MIRPAIVGTIILTCATIGGPANPASHARQPVTINQSALDYARKLIANGHVVNDKHGGWTEHKPSAERKNEFIRQHGFEQYGLWHLGVEESHRSDSKARYKFPFGDFKNVHRCALIAVQNRARQYGYREIDDAASELLKTIEQKR